MGNVLKLVTEGSENNSLADVKSVDEALSGLRSFHGGICPDCHKNHFNKMSGWKGSTCVMKAKCPDCGFEFIFEQKAPEGAMCYETSSIQSSFEQLAFQKIAEYKRIDHDKKKVAVLDYKPKIVDWDVDDD